MDNTTSKEKILKVIECVKKFSYTDFYFILIGLVVFFGWYLKNPAFGFASLIIISCLMLLILDDVTPLVANIFFAPQLLYSSSLDDYLFILPAFIPLGLCMIYFLIKNGRHRFTLGKMFYPQLAVSVALLLGGVGAISSEDYLRALGMVLGLGFGVLAVYEVGNHYIKNDSKRDFTIILAKIMFYIGLLVCAQMLTRIVDSGMDCDHFVLIDLDLGWGVWTNVGSMISITAPFGLYLSIKYKHSFCYLFLSFVMYIFLYMTYAIGAIVFGYIALLFAIIFMFLCATNRIRLFANMFISLIILAIVFLIFKDDILNIITGIKDRDFTNRGELYREAVSVFTDNLFLGAGLGYIGINYNINDISFYWFHSTFFQIIANMGIVGIVTYLYMYVSKVVLLIQNYKHSFNLFMIVLAIAFEGFAIIDTGTFVPFPYMMLVMVLVLFMEKNTGKHDDGYVDEYNALTPKGKRNAYLQRIISQYGSEEFK